MGTSASAPPCQSLILAIFTLALLYEPVNYIIIAVGLSIPVGYFKLRLSVVSKLSRFEVLDLQRSN